MSLEKQKGHSPLGPGLLSVFRRVRVTLFYFLRILPLDVNMGACTVAMIFEIGMPRRAPFSTPFGSLAA